ncbi:pilus assembly PilX family protein [Aromatoleum buckelii]|uniref:Type 4 fimbrial biogenesis protein PilX N-terminal domain-containing protein n=1 Tax=Aromatoleum buckelii TaxID=200254 RepID=A0ABX1N720_9RHOO|nr:hypothetical protein [Aromatoleum buckelii]MCK0511267.1 hypothetical protein [Aromatoleum buckelii]
MNKRRNTIRMRQHGVAMIVALVLLVAATLTALFTNRNLVFGVKSQANQIKSIMAQEAAMGGLEASLAVLAKKTNREKLLIGSPSDPVTDPWYDGTLYGFFLDTSNTPNGLVDEVRLAATTDGTMPTAPVGVNISSFQARFKRLSTPSTITDPNRAILINVLGCADGQAPGAAACTSRALATQSVVFKPSMVSAPSAALTAKGNVSFSGNVTITNTEAATNGTTVHAGGTYTSDGSADLVTVPGTPPEASVAKEDSTLSNLTGDRFFQGFFGESKDSVKAEAVQIDCNGPCPSAIDSVDGQGKVIWVNTTSGAQINSNVTIGTASEPVILIVDGPLQINGNVVIYGVVYCSAFTWNNSGGGTSQIIGAAIAEGNFQATGTPNPTYDSNVLNNVKRNLGSYVRIPGGWKDWCNDCDFH